MGWSTFVLTWAEVEDAGSKSANIFLRVQFGALHRRRQHFAVWSVQG